MTLPLFEVVQPELVAATTSFHPHTFHSGIHGSRPEVLQAEARKKKAPCYTPKKKVILEELGEVWTLYYLEILILPVSADLYPVRSNCYSRT